MSSNHGKEHTPSSFDDEDDDESDEHVTLGRKRSRGERISQGNSRNRVEVLREWMFSDSHYHHPYPIPWEQLDLAFTAQMSVRQVTFWFTNARKRLWTPWRQSRKLMIPSAAIRMRAQALSRQANTSVAGNELIQLLTERESVTEDEVLAIPKVAAAMEDARVRSGAVLARDAAAGASKASRSGSSRRPVRRSRRHSQRSRRSRYAPSSSSSSSPPSPLSSLSSTPSDLPIRSYHQHHNPQRFLHPSSRPPAAAPHILFGSAHVAPSSTHIPGNPLPPPPRLQLAAIPPPADSHSHEPLPKRRATGERHTGATVKLSEVVRTLHAVETTTRTMHEHLCRLEHDLFFLGEKVQQLSAIVAKKRYHQSVLDPSMSASTFGIGTRESTESIQSHISHTFLSRFGPSLRPPPQTGTGAKSSTSSSSLSLSPPSSSSSSAGTSTFLSRYGEVTRTVEPSTSYLHARTHMPATRPAPTSALTSAPNSPTHSVPSRDSRGTTARDSFAALTLAASQANID